MALSGPWVLCAAEARADSELPSFSAPLAPGADFHWPSPGSQSVPAARLTKSRREAFRDSKTETGFQEPSSQKQPQTSGSEVRTQVRQVMVVVGR